MADLSQRIDRRWLKAVPEAGPSRHGRQTPDQGEIERLRRDGARRNKGAYSCEDD